MEIYVKEMNFDPGFDIIPTVAPMGFRYGSGVFGPEVEYRSLDSIRKSLRDPKCTGPDPVYAIAMDTGKREHLPMLVERKLLFGAVTYAAGRLGREPVRSQGHVHKKVRGNTLSPPEIYEIWTGRAIICMQEYAEDDPGRCFAVEAAPGDVVVVPPDWAHATISADPREALTFGAWCDREYGFEYERVRAYGGLAWFPVFGAAERIEWIANPAYRASALIEKTPESYPKLGIKKGVPIYTAFEHDPDVFLYVSDPGSKAAVWKNFVP
jgi:glucose-6-phosphate isomerase, archaeal